MPKSKKDRDHDIFIKGILTLHEFVLALLYRFLPQTIQKYADFSTLKLFSSTHISNKLLAQYSDHIHECALLKSNLPPEYQNLPDLPVFRFCFLWEHKSSKPNEPIESQTDRYKYAILDDDKKNKRVPSIVIALLIYHGKEKWDKKLVYEQLAPYLPADLLEYVAYPKIIAIDIQAMSPKEIAEMVDLNVLRAAFIALKNAHDKEFFQQYPEEILKFVENSPIDYLFQSFFEMLLEYMQRRSELEEAEFNKNIEQKMNQDMGTQVRTMFERAREEGAAEGEARGEARILRRNIESLIQETQWTDDKIAHVLRTTEDFVKQVRLELAVAAQPALPPAAAQPPKKARAKKSTQPKAKKIKK